MKKEIKLYNVCFPIWLITLYPSIWGITLLMNCLLGSLLLILGYKLLKIKEVKAVYHETALKVLSILCLADLMSLGFVLMSQWLQGEWWEEYIKNPIVSNPLDNIWSIGYLSILLIGVAGMTYELLWKWGFKTKRLQKLQRKQLSLAFVLINSSWMLFYPSQLIYSPQKQVMLLSNHLISEGYHVMTLTGQAESKLQGSRVPVSLAQSLQAAINTADLGVRVTPEEEADYELKLYRSAKSIGKYEALALKLWQLGQQEIWIQAGDKWYQMKAKRAIEVAAILQAAEEDGLKQTFTVYGVGKTKKPIYSDETYEYLTYVESGGDLYIDFEDHTWMSVSKALKLNLISLEDLSDKNIEVIKRLKSEVPVQKTGFNKSLEEKPEGPPLEPHESPEHLKLERKPDKKPNKEIKAIS